MIEYDTGFFSANAAYIPLDEQEAPVEEPAAVSVAEDVALNEHPEDVEDEEGEPPAESDEEGEPPAESDEEGEPPL